MVSLIKRALGGLKGQQTAVSNVNLERVVESSPPSPDLAGLGPEELQILNDVFRRQTEFERNELERIERIREKELEKYEEMIRTQSDNKKRAKHVDLRLCKLCFKTKFADGIGRLCYDCHKRVCGRCGSFTRPRWNVKKNKSVRGKWRCSMCQLKRETLCETGQWYGGAQTPTGQVMMNKLNYYGTESESDVSNSKLASDSERIPFGNLTDSELIRSMDSTRNISQLLTKKARRCSLPMSSHVKSFDEDEDDIDEDNEEKLHRERLLFRQKRQQRKWRRRYLPDIYHSEESTAEMTSDALFSSGLSSEERKRPKLKGRYMSLPKLQLTTKFRSKSKLSSDSMTDESSGLSYIGKESSFSESANSSVHHNKMQRQDAVYCSSSSSLAEITGGNSSPHPPRHKESKIEAFRAIQSCCYHVASKEELLSRRVTLSQCENIEICKNSTFSGVVTSAVGNPHEVILHKDKSDPSQRTKGLGMRVVGGQESDDGEMGAFVTMVIKGGPADVQGGIKEGDQILECDGQSLVGVTFEEARDITDKAGNVVQLVVSHQSQSNKSSAGTEKKRVLNTGVSFVMASPPVISPRRRMLPPTPIEIKKTTRKVSGRILVQISHSSNEQTLSVHLLKAEDIRLPDGAKRVPKPFAMVHILPQRSLFDFYETEAKLITRTPEWNVTYTYDDIDNIEVQRLSVEITIWSQQLNGDIFVGEVLLDLKDGLPTEQIWYDLEDHDENSSPLPDRKSSLGDISEADILIGSQDITDKERSIRRSLPTTPSYEHSTPQFVRIPTVSGYGNEEISTPLSTPSTTPEPGFKSDKRQSLSRMVKMRMSNAVSRVSLTLSAGDKRDSVTDSNGNSSRKLTRGKSIEQPEPIHSPKSRNSSISNVNLEMLAPPLPLSSRRSSNTSYNTDNPSENDTELLRELPETPDSNVPDDDEITSMLGLGQVTPMPSAEGGMFGDVKLGFIITKGQLEVDIYSARNLCEGGCNSAPDTYIKTYLVEGKKIIQKKKTSLVKGTNPQYKSKIKYSASNVHGRHMRITIWEKSKGFEKKNCVGEAVVKLDNLDLSQHNMAWYKLFKQNATSLGSNESLHW